MSPEIKDIYQEHVHCRRAAGAAILRALEFEGAAPPFVPMNDPRIKSGHI